MKTQIRMGYVYLKSFTYEALAPPPKILKVSRRILLTAAAFFRRPRLYTEEALTKRGVHFKRFI